MYFYGTTMYKIFPSKTSFTGQIPLNTFATSFANFLDDRYRKLQGTSTPLRLDWNSFVVPLPRFGWHLDSNRLQNWALNRLHCRHKTRNVIQEHSIQILSHNNLTLKFEITPEIENSKNCTLSLSPQNIFVHFCTLHLSQHNLPIITIDIQKRL